jgi:hypothetical protein
MGPALKNSLFGDEGFGPARGKKNDPASGGTTLEG